MPRQNARLPRTSCGIDVADEGRRERTEHDAFGELLRDHPVDADCRAETRLDEDGRVVDEAVVGDHIRRDGRKPTVAANDEMKNVMLADERNGQSPKACTRIAMQPIRVHSTGGDTVKATEEAPPMPARAEWMDSRAIAFHEETCGARTIAMQASSSAHPAIPCSARNCR